ncbi:MAG: hypothetical protein QOD75_3999 [Blastocatellia bacterium]|jgi:L-rhamnose mutarotase|nr:hypothetical protein [Blastocatellia bacterium]
MIYQGMDPLLKDWIQVGSWAAAIIGGLIAAGVGIFQLRANRKQREIELRWNRARLAGELYDKMFATSKEALLMLDYYRDNKAFAAIPGADKTVGLNDILAALDTANRTDKSIYIRERLDELFYIFERIENAVEDDLVVFCDVKYPSEYYAGILAKHKDEYTAYLHEVGYERVPRFLNRFEKWRDDNKLAGECRPPNAKAGLADKSQ